MYIKQCAVDALEVASDVQVASKVIQGLGFRDLFLHSMRIPWKSNMLCLVAGVVVGRRSLSSLCFGYLLPAQHVRG